MIPSPSLFRAAAFGALLCTALPVGAQTYILQNGTTLSDADVKLQGNSLVQEVSIGGGGTAERRFPLSTVARLDFPEPTELAEAATHIAAGKGADALALVEPIYRQFAPFSRTPGSWWSEAALLRLRALLLQEKLPEAGASARELMAGATDPEAVGTAKLALAEIDARNGQDALAQAMLDEIVRDAPPGVKARAWILRGDLALKRNAFEEAIEAYLHVPAFYGTQEHLMPAALLGSARAFKGYGDADRSERAYLEVMDGYPESAQAAVAKREAGF